VSGVLVGVALLLALRFRAILTAAATR
jgi:hypothetical protein